MAVRCPWMGLTAPGLTSHLNPTGAMELSQFGEAFPLQYPCQFCVAGPPVERAFAHLQCAEEFRLAARTILRVDQELEVFVLYIHCARQLERQAVLRHSVGSWDVCWRNDSAESPATLARVEF